RVAARAVLDEEVLPRLFGELLCQQPADHVGRPARRKGQYDLYGFGRILGRNLDGKKNQQQEKNPLHALIFGTSSHFFCFQLFSPSSASCTPLAPSSSPQRNGPSPATCLRNISHCTLKALS